MARFAAARALVSSTLIQADASTMSMRASSFRSVSANIDASEENDESHTGHYEEKRRAALCQRGSIGWGRRNEPSLTPEMGFGRNGILRQLTNSQVLTAVANSGR